MTRKLLVSCGKAQFHEVVVDFENHDTDLMIVTILLEARKLFQPVR